MPYAEVFAYSPDIVNPDAIDGETKLDIFAERGVFGQGLEEQLFPGDLFVTRVERPDGTSAVGVYVDCSTPAFEFWSRFHGTSGNRIIVSLIAINGG